MGLDFNVSIIHLKMQEYQTLESKLGAVLEALIERERQLNLKEVALNTAQQDLEKNLETRANDFINDVQRRVRGAEQALGAEQQRNSRLHNEVTNLLCTMDKELLF